MGSRAGHGQDASRARAGNRAGGRPVDVPTTAGHGGMLDDVPVPVRVMLGVLLVVMVLATGIGFVLSYEALHRLADRYGVGAHGAWFWPAATDSLIVIGELGTAVFLWMHRSRRHWWQKVSWVFVGFTVLGFGLSLAANMVEAGRDPVARFVASVPPVIALLAFGGVARVGHELLDRWQGHAQPTPVTPVPDDQVVPVVPVPPPPPVVPVPALPVAAPARRVAAARAPRPAVVVPVSEGVPGDVTERVVRARRLFRDALKSGTYMTVPERMRVSGLAERTAKKVWKQAETDLAEERTRTGVQHEDDAMEEQ